MGNANQAGQEFEDYIEEMVVGEGMTPMDFRDWNPKKDGWEVLLCKVPYESIYEKYSSRETNTSKSEFMLVSRQHGLITRIEARWQRVSGSVDEKLPYMYKNLKQTLLDPEYPETHAIIVMDGGGAKEHARRWLEEQARQFNQEHAPEVRLDIFTLGEFLAWTTTHLQDLTTDSKKGLQERARWTGKIDRYTRLSVEKLRSRLKEQFQQRFSAEAVRDFHRRHTDHHQ